MKVHCRTQIFTGMIQVGPREPCLYEETSFFQSSSIVDSRGCRTLAQVNFSRMTFGGVRSDLITAPTPKAHVNLA